MDQRPTKREIDKRLKEAKQALREGKGAYANAAKISGELTALNVFDATRLWELILRLMEEITLDDYEGAHPPQKSREPAIADCELWAFAWNSSLLKKRMYLKFAVYEGIFYYVSLHKSKFLEEGTYEMSEMHE